MKNITFLNAMHKVKYPISNPITLSLAEKAENIRVKGSEKWLVRLRNGSDKWLVSLRNSITETD